MKSFIDNKHFILSLEKERERESELMSQWGGGEGQREREILLNIRLAHTHCPLLLISSVLPQNREFFFFFGEREHTCVHVSWG